jgi:hypothetical protein
MISSHLGGCHQRRESPELGKDSVSLVNESEDLQKPTITNVSRCS